MPGRLLVDTSAWIVSFKKAGHEQLKKTIVAALDTLSVATTNIVVIELLQGCRNRNEYDAMHARLEALEALQITDAVWSLAYATGYELRRKGITTVPTVDILIAAIAKIHDCSLLHHDKHFRALAKHLHINAVDFIDN
jgi:predicted nucleic acid-binding protein